MLSSKDILNIHDALDTCHEVSDIDGFKSFIATAIRGVFPHVMALCGLIELGSGRVLRLINIDFSPGGLHAVIPPGSGVLSAPLREGLHSKSPVLLPEADLACHGITALGGMTSSYFVFAHPEARDPALCKSRLTLIVPHLHAALMTVLAYDRPARDDVAGDITDRERQVLRWVAAGKSNWEIGKILRISEFTVKNHVQNLLKKLAVCSRAQAATKAVSCGLIAEGDLFLPGNGSRAPQPPAGRSHAVT